MESTASAPGLLHRYAPGLIAFEHIPRGSDKDEDSSTTAINYLVFVGGQGDGLFTVPIAEGLHELGEQWHLVEVLVSSSYTGWGMGSLKRDVDELVRCVQYFKKLNSEAKIVLMGHSTGSQDTLQYLIDSSEESPHKIDGAILQAPASDREALVDNMNRTSYLTSMTFAESWVKNGQGEEIIPRDMRPGFENTPISAERWFSIAAPLDKSGKPQGNDDYFSSDISEKVLEGTFGKIPPSTQLLILYPGNDEFVPAHVDKEALVGRWITVCRNAGVRVDEGSGVVLGSTHTLKDAPEEVWNDFSARVRSFLTKV